MGSVVISDVGCRYPHGLLSAGTRAHTRNEHRSEITFAPFPSTTTYSERSAIHKCVHSLDPVNTSNTRARVAEGHKWQTHDNDQRERLVANKPASIYGSDLRKQLTMSQDVLARESRPRGNKATVAAEKGSQDVESSCSSSSQHTSPVVSVPSPTDSRVGSPHKIRVNSLSHIQSFAMDQSSPISQVQSASGYSRRAPDDAGLQYEISSMPVTDIIEMVAGLLTKITTTNDQQHDYLHRQVPSSDGSAGLSQQTTSVLAFHGKNVPSITILSYLTRIHKYCPTTYEVFLSLLIYFDRMTERVNTEPMNSMRQDSVYKADHRDTSRDSKTSSSQISQHPMDKSRDSLRRTQSSVATTGEIDGSKVSSSSYDIPSSLSSSSFIPGYETEASSCDLSHFFVVDSFNIHRLVIAGVTCASKFFSDVFYTNSRYAKVGANLSDRRTKLKISHRLEGFLYPNLTT